MSDDQDVPQAPKNHDQDVPEPPYEVIWDEMKARRVVPFLGAAASMVGREKGAVWDS